ncbi:MAG: ABC transporter permease [Acidimicrobiales bacterium]
MSGLHGMGLVAGREIRQAFRRKSFWIVMAILFVGSTAAMVIPDLVSDDSVTSYDIVVVDSTPSLDASIQATVHDLDAEAVIQSATDRGAARTAVDDGKADVAIVAGADPTVFVQANEHDRLVGAVQQALAVNALTTRLEAAGLSPETVTQSLTSPTAAVEQLRASEADRRGASFVLSLVLYMLLLTLLIQVANGTAVEKANRISEVLLAIVPPGALLFGKVVGIGVTGILTLAAALFPVTVKLTLGGDLPPGLGGAVAASGAWFVLGLSLYLTIAGALGALVERQEEAGSVVSPLTALLIGTFIVVQSDADSPLGTVLGYLPLTSPLAEPARLAIGASSPTEVVGSLALSIMALVVVVRIGSTIFGRAIVRTGRRLKIRDVIRPTQRAAPP